MRFIILAFFFSLVSVCATNASNAQDYCRPDGNSYRAYFALRLDASGQEIEAYKNGIDTIFNELQVGDKVEVFFSHDTGASKIFSGCYPGCPPQGIIDQLFGLNGGGCKATLAKRDQIEFRRKFSSLARHVVQDAKNGNAGFADIMNTLLTINTHYKSNHDLDAETIILSSMFNTDKLSKQNFDKFFVNSVQSTTFPKSFPALQVLGMPLNAGLIELWQDLYSVNNQAFNHR